MMAVKKITIYKVLVKVLRPLVKILLRNTISHGEFNDIAKQIFVDVADKELAIEGRKHTVSRIAILTGLSRKEVLRLRNLESEISIDDRTMNRAERVIQGWMRDSEFQDQDGKPLQLPLKNGKPTFKELVKKYSGDIPVPSLLEELLYMGVVVENQDGSVALVNEAYVPQNSIDEKLPIAANSVCDLLDTLDHNLQCENDEARLQLSVEYDNLPEECLDTFHNLSAEKSYELLNHLNKWLSKQDRDCTPEVKGKGRYRAGIGLYYFQQNYK